MKNRLQVISFTFQNGCQVACRKPDGFSSAFEAAQMLHNTDVEMESMRIAYVHEMLEKSKTN